MNTLEKLNELLTKSGRTIVYGQPVTATVDTLVALSLGDSDTAIHSLREQGSMTYTTVNITVYAVNYLTGFNTLLEVKNEIGSAVKSSTNIMFSRFCESKYDAELQRYVLKSQYKIIE